MTHNKSDSISDITNENDMENDDEKCNDDNRYNYSYSDNDHMTKMIIRIRIKQNVNNDSNDENNK